MADKGQRTEKPTQRRLDKARREGQFPAAKELVSAAQFLGFMALLATGGHVWYAAMRHDMGAVLKRAFAADLRPGDIPMLGGNLLLRNGAPLLAAGCAMLLLTMAARLATTRMGLTVKQLAPNFQRLNPLTRIRELPRQNLPALVQAVIMLPVFAGAVYLLVRDNLDAYLMLPLQPLELGFRKVALSLRQLLWQAAGLFVVFGVVDLFRQRRRYQRDLRMSKQEVREEFKEIEGNPQIKMRIRRLQRDVLRRRMMQQVPKATAVVVNPTHYAVAIRYRMDAMAAPTVVAKGRNYLALRIREKARQHQVPIVENPPLAQALYQSAEVGQEIPAHLYRAVAEILAYIYRLMNGHLPGTES